MRTILLSLVVIFSFITQASASSICPTPEHAKQALEDALKDHQYSVDWKRIFTKAVLQEISKRNKEVTGFYSGTEVANKVVFPDLDRSETYSVGATHCRYTVKGTNDLVLKLQIMKSSK